MSRITYLTHLGETVIPYATLDPLKSVLPINPGSGELEKDDAISHGVRSGSLTRNMQRRWRDVDTIWTENKSAANSLRLLDQLDYYDKLSSQLAWRRAPSGRPIRIVYTTSGEPTAAILEDDNAVVDHLLYWITSATEDEAFYLVAIVNSRTLSEAVKPLMPKGQFGARHVHKHLWWLPIPEFDGGDSLHLAIANAGRQAAVGVERELERLREARPGFTVAIARREIRKWLRESAEGQRVEEVVGVLLGG